MRESKSVREVNRETGEEDEDKKRGGGVYGERWRQTHEINTIFTFFRPRFLSFSRV